MSMQTHSPNDDLDAGGTEPEPQGSCVVSEPWRPRPKYADALRVLLADCVVFAHKLSAADWSVDHERVAELRDLFLALDETAERMNGDLLACAAEAGLKPTRPPLADAFEHNQLAATAPARPDGARAEETLADIKHLNSGLREAAQLAEQVMQGDASLLLLASADEIEGFGWLLAAWLN